MFSIQLMRKMTSELECMVVVKEDMSNDESDDYATGLHAAVKDNDIPTIWKLLEDGAKVCASDKFGRTPLHWAVVYSHQEAARALIVNTKKRALDRRDRCGCTALHYAALGGRTEVGRILIERGAQVNSVDSRNRTPLHFAAQHPKPAMVEMLISRGADKSHRDFRDHLPCDVALEWASFSSLACLRLDSQKQYPNLKCHPMDLVDEQGEGGAVPMEQVPIRKGPYFDKLLASRKQEESGVTRKKETESEMVTKASAELQIKLQEWRTAEHDARLRQGGDSKSITVDGSGNGTLPQDEEKLPHAVLYHRDEPFPSRSSALPPLNQDLIRDSSSSIDCLDDESYLRKSPSSFFYSATNSCRGDLDSSPNLHEWLDASKQYSREVLPWCTEWEVELPHRSSDAEQMSCEDTFDSRSIFPRDRKGKTKALSEEEPLWVRVWPKSSSSSSCSASPSCSASLSP